MSLDEYASNFRNIENAKRQRQEHPKGWEPGLNTAKKEIISKPMAKAEKPEDHRWDAYLTELGFNPNDFEIIEPFEIRTWTANMGGGETQQFYYYKAKIISKNLENEKDFDYKALLKEIKTSKPKSAAKTSGPSSFVVCLSDWQMGKRDGDGTAGIVERVETMIPSVEERYKTLRKQGVELGTLYIYSLGDMIENCDGFYAMQTATVEYDLRRQLMITRRLLAKAIKRWSKDFDNVVVACVPGNHGENRKNGKAYTTFGDNFDVTLFDNLQEMFSENKAYDHVNFIITDNDLWLTLNVSGKIIGLAHGHQFRTGGKYSHQKAINWLSNQAFGMTDMGDVDILISGHFHHLFIINEGKRVLMQCLSMDGGSDWFENLSGKKSFSGTLTFSVSETEERIPFQNLEVL